jgi:uncharacterized protein (DUF697 family)
MPEETKKVEEAQVTLIPSEKDVDRIIADHVGFSMLAGAIPIPVLDMAAVTAVQMDMLRQLAKKYGIDFNDEKGKSIVTAVIGSTIGTSVGRFGASMVKFIPVIGSVVGMGSQAILSGATTFAIGHLFDEHFREHKPLSEFNFADVKGVFEEFLEKGKEFAGSVKKQMKIDAKDMKRRTAEVLRSMAAKGILKQSDCDRIVRALGE